MRPESSRNNNNIDEIDIEKLISDIQEMTDAFMTKITPLNRIRYKGYQRKMLCFS